ncbi:MAG: UDP-N-acetylmuramate dehydrogenase [Coriobacteriaceae bacterium]
MSTAEHSRLVCRLRTLVGDTNVVTDEPMVEHTTFRIGGPADVFVTPGNAQEIVQVLDLCKELDEPYFVLGRGSDLLVSDAGYRGVIVSLVRLNKLELHGTQVICGAGVTLKKVAAFARDDSLTGLEFASGIPGSVGGAVFMNAGAYGGETADVVSSIRALNPEGKLATYRNAELEFGYRQSLVRRVGLIVLEVTYSLKLGDKEQIQATMNGLAQRRREKQPLEYPSAGSTFKRPKGYFAGKLITDAGLKGYRVGNACVSEKHAGFVVNLGGATAKDIHAVIEHVQDEVQRQFGVHLEPEVRFLG